MKLQPYLFFEGRAEEKFEVSCGEGFSSGQTLFRWIREANPSGAPILLDPTLLSVAHEQDASRGLRALLALQPVLRDFDTTEALIRGTLSVLGEVISQAADLIAIPQYTNHENRRSTRPYLGSPIRVPNG